MAAVNPNYMALPKKCTLWVFLVIILMGVLALALWLDLRHQTPSITMTDFSVSTKIGRNQHPKIYVAVNLKNPNPVYRIDYDYTVIKIYHSDGTLGQTNTLVPSGFHLPKSKDGEVSDHMDADVQTWKALLQTLAHAKEATLKVELKIGIRYHNLGHSSKQYTLKFQGQFKIGSDGKVLGGNEVKLCKGSC